jgi:hypothetical protein
MNEGCQTEYFRKPETIASSMVDAIESPKIAEDSNTTEDTNHSIEALINQNIIKLGDYRNNKATRKEIAHVRFEPD